MSKSQDALHESLSAAIDAEAGELELRRALKAAADDPALRGKWARAHLIRSVMRGEAPAGVARCPVWPQDEAEGPAAGRAKRWLGPAAGIGVAAAAAMAVVLYFGPDGSLGGEAEVPAIASVDYNEPVRRLAQVPSEADLHRANAYMLQHAQHTAIAARSPAMPFARALSAPPPLNTGAPAAQGGQRTR